VHTCVKQGFVLNVFIFVINYKYKYVPETKDVPERARGGGAEAPRPAGVTEVGARGGCVRRLTDPSSPDPRVGLPGQEAPPRLLSGQVPHRTQSRINNTPRRSPSVFSAISLWAVERGSGEAGGRK
jgi:hypothetical protein